MQEESYSFPFVIGDAPVDELGLSVRSTNALRNNGILKLSQLFELTEEKLFSMRNLGAKSVREILAAKTFYSEQFGISDGTADIAIPEPAAPSVPETVSFLNDEGVFCEDIPIDALGLSVRSYNCLRRGGYEYASQLIGVTREDLLKIKNMGAKSADEILAVVQKLEFRAAEEDTNDVTAEPQANPQKERLTDFCREVYEGIGVAPKMLYAALEKLTADGASLTGESLYYRAYDLPFMKAALKEQIYSYLYEAEFDPVGRDSLDSKLPAHLFNTTITDEALIDLENEGMILETDEGYVCRYPRCTEFAASIENENERLCLLERLKGRTLEEIGQENGWTRERVRQLMDKALNRRGRPRLHEDQYAYLFDHYCIAKVDFCSVFHEPPETFEYLSLTGKKNKRAGAALEEALTDPSLSEKTKRRLQKIIYKNCIFIDGEPIKVDRQVLVLYAIRLFARERIAYEDFTARYLQWLNELGLGDREELQYNLRTYENKIMSLNCVLWNYKNSFRYYDVEAVNADDFCRALSLEQYADLAITSRLIFNSYPEVMTEYDIRDEYELHNLLRKLEADKLYPELKIVFGKMPTITFGAGNAEAQALDLMIELAPISCEDLAYQYELRYGIRRDTAAGFLLSWLGDYYYQGMFTVDAESLPSEEYNAMKERLTQDFYLKKEILLLYKRLFPQGDPKRINSYTLKSMGFHVYGAYVVSQRFSNATDYFDHLLLDQPITNMNDVDTRFSTITAYSSELIKLKASRRIVEFSPKQYITIERLNECGITLADLERYCKDVAALTEEGEFFTLQSLRKQGFADELDDYGFDDWFYMSLLCEDREHFSFRRVANSKLFCRGKTNVVLGDFLISVMLREQKMDFYDFCDLLEREYGLSIDIYKLKAMIRESGLYYNDIMDKVYIDYETYYEEV